jgi:hypothetical protein
LTARVNQRAAVESYAVFNPALTTISYCLLTDYCLTVILV